MKGTVYGNRLPRGTQVKKGWEPLKLVSSVMLCKSDSVEGFGVEIRASDENA
jgi:hypothetical protein